VRRYFSAELTAYVCVHAPHFKGENMKTRITALAVALSLLLVAPLNAAAAAKDKDTKGLSVPVTGTFTDQSGGAGKFAGTLTVHRFAAVNNRVHAVGVIDGTLTDAAGNVVATGLQTVSLPVTLSGGSSAAPSAAHKTTPAQPEFRKAAYVTGESPTADRIGASAPPAAAAQLSCEILRLSIGAINLDLLGLTVSLNPVLLVISAVPGAGNLLGNLLCAIVGLLDGVGTLIQIVNLLNQLLALLASL
jgi:hypothetical protein